MKKKRVIFCKPHGGNRGRKRGNSAGCSVAYRRRITELETAVRLLQSEYDALKEYLRSCNATTRRIDSPFPQVLGCKVGAESGQNTEITYEQLLQTPDLCECERVTFRGEVVQILEDADGIDLRLTLDAHYQDILYCTLEQTIPLSSIQEGDTITIHGTSVGLITYEAATGACVTIPCVVADQIEQ